MSLRNKGISPHSINQTTLQADAGALKILAGLLVPGILNTGDPSGGPILVGKGNIIKVRIQATSYIVFGDSTLVQPDNTTPTALELYVDAGGTANGVFMVVATDDFMMMDQNPFRIEVIPG